MRLHPGTSSQAVLSVVFFLSGFSALVYQVVWQRLLTLHYGVGAVSTALTVTLFMAGLGLGALAGGWLGDRVRGRLALYAAIELAIGAYGLGSFALLEGIGRATAGSDLATALACTALFLAPPTLLMGMTLPLLTRVFTAATGDFDRAVSRLYFVNAAGAAAGALASAYVFITLGGFDTALEIAAATNGAMALMIVFLARPAPRETFGDADAARAAGLAPAPLGRLAIVVLVTGFLAIGYEIVWIRFLGVLFKESPYAFATVLAVYLAGLGAGSWWMAGRLPRLAPHARRPMLLGLQVGIAAYVLASFLGFYWTSDVVPFKWLHAQSFASGLHPPIGWPGGGTAMELARSAFVAADILFWPLVFVLVPTVAMGATFPLAAALARARGGGDAVTVARIYAWTILGNALGGLATGLLLLPALGTERTLQIFIFAGLAFAFFRLSGEGPLLRLPRSLALVAVAVAGLAAFPGPGKLYEAVHPQLGYGSLQLQEGREGVVLTYRDGDRVRNIINGTLHGGRPDDAFVRRGIETLAYTPSPRRVLVIGYGTGELADTLLRSPEVELLVVVEVNHALMANLRKFPSFRDALAEPRLRLLMDDGRRFLLRDPGRFDAILMDPIYHHAAYSNNLYSRQFFELARSRLAPGGVLMVWSDEHRVVPRTLAAVFPHLRKYDGAEPRSHGYYLASVDAFSHQAERERALLGGLDAARRDRVAAVSSYQGDRAEILRRAGPGTVNEDWKPRAEYYLGLGRR